MPRVGGEVHREACAYRFAGLSTRAQPATQKPTSAIGWATSVHAIRRVVQGRAETNYVSSFFQDQLAYTFTLIQEGFDLRKQARWKLERAVEAAITTKRWDAAGVAAFALAEVLGGDDSPAAAGALMLHQVWETQLKLFKSILIFDVSGNDKSTLLVKPTTTL